MSNNKESLINLLTQKPWEPAQAKVDNLHEGKTFNLHVGKLGLRYIMVVSTIMFCLFIFGPCRLLRATEIYKQISMIFLEGF